MCYPHEVDKGLRPDDLHAVPFIIHRHNFDDEGLAHALDAHDVVTRLHQTHICAHQHHFLQQCLSCSTSEASLALSRRRRQTEGRGKVKKRFRRFCHSSPAGGKVFKTWRRVQAVEEEKKEGKDKGDGAFTWKEKSHDSAEAQ